jgi:hypothetical protein
MSATKFLNVDLDLHSESGLEELVDALGSAVVDLNRDEENRASVELAEQPQSIDGAVLAFYNLITDLPPKVRTIWDHCEVRSMNIGIQVGSSPYSEGFKLSSNTISLLSSINAEIVVTTYVAVSDSL